MLYVFYTKFEIQKVPFLSFYVFTIPFYLTIYPFNEHNFGNIFIFVTH